MSLRNKILSSTLFLILTLTLLIFGTLIHSYITHPKITLTPSTNNFFKDKSTYITASQYISSQTKSPYHFWIGEIGPSGPLFTGPHQYPFICTTIRFGLGQPIIDNTDNIGVAVFPSLFGYPMTILPPIGYSKDCSIYTRVDYYYFSNSTKKFHQLSPQSPRPADIATINIDQRDMPFIVRVERGTINRFIYSIAMLAPNPEATNTPKHLDNSAWNGKLVYKFQGGIGLGHNQGIIALNKKNALLYDALSRGFAVAYSTGTRTTTHYNLKLAEETAMMVKLHFEAIYGSPKFTIGVGGSGGAVQQHIIAQNNPGIIDAAVAQASFPDMITQSIYVPDCELLERYFDSEYLIDKNSPWRSWQNRSYVEGSTTSDTAVIARWDRSPAPKPGSSECIAGWRGTIPSVFNPHWTHPAYHMALNLFKFPSSTINKIKWTHWNDLGNIYPRDNNGYAANSWDNVGVQYGLSALNSGLLSTEDFIDLNACVGGWKPPKEMKASISPWDKNADPNQFDPWDSINMNLSANCKQGKPAPRTAGSIPAMQAAYTSGHVFSGKIDIPILDVRWYLEPILDMHHSIASFSTRARIEKSNGFAHNQIIWVAECSELDLIKLRKNCQYNPTADALKVIDEWMENIKSSPSNSILASKPEKAVDTCFNGDGSVMYAGSDAWDGIINKRKAGICSEAFPVSSTSRMVAGSSIIGSTFKCALKAVSTALTDGTYKDIQFSPLQITKLKEIFPLGVCDYSKTDTGLP